MSDLSVDAEQDESLSVDAEQVTDQEAGTSENATPEQDASPSDDGGKPKGAEGYEARMRWKAAEAERKAEEAERKARELERKLAEKELGSKPEVPPVPDQFDDDYQEKMRLRDEAILAVQEHERRAAELKAQNERFEQEQRQREYEQHQRAMQEKEAEYVQRIKASGLAAEEVTAHLSKLSAEHPQMPEPMRLALVDDPDSPLIAKYLAENPSEAYALYGMNPYQGTVHVATEIKQKALALKPKPSSAPPPADTLDGGGKTEFESPYLDGATFS